MARPSLAFTVVWLVLLTAGEACCLACWPRTPHPTMIAPYSIVVGLLLAAWVSAAVHLVWVLATGRQMGPRLRIVKIALCGGLVLVAAAAVIETVTRADLHRVEGQLAPLVEHLRAHPAPAEEGWRALVPAPEPEGLRIWRGPSGFVVAVAGASGDIDAVTLVYNSASPGWRRMRGREEVAAIAHRRGLALVHPSPPLAPAVPGR